ncbi:glycolipid 2-alpha-mannosyltransferase [Nitzschia inconspicua]|uniref:Glycolipid 2-alpha-mannosyltransferase n=1 Tax=Nitzschia inconspicua TaxID=303405 RepID=A0A9K3KNC0_9STRA|nr:glycolipid 2-alpha-mannosyltransferase [Nitzschia inconspicua]
MLSRRNPRPSTERSVSGHSLSPNKPNASNLFINGNIQHRDHVAAARLPRQGTVRQMIMAVSVMVVCLTILNLHGHTSISSNHNDSGGNKSILPPNNLWHDKTPQSPTHHACDGYNGIYHIEKGDIGGAAGTIFFQFVIGQIMWAERYNFKPWVYLNNVSDVIYDEEVHGKGEGVTVNMQQGMEISYVRRPMGHRRDAYPGAPFNATTLRPHSYHFDGDGVWQNYFEPVSDFVPGDKSCVDKPLVTMDIYLVTPGIHGFAPWAPRCWRYHYLPDYITKPHLPITEWLEPQRHAAHDVLKRYIRFQPHIRERAEHINPSCSLQNPCLGIHIRQSDKAAGRRQIQTDEFLPFVEAFLQAGGKWVYLATDSHKVMQHIQASWPRHVKKVIRSMGDDVVRSNDFQAVFDIGSHHRTNTEILTEILALSQCQFLIHGLSAVTESSIWINVDLHDNSVNLEDPGHLNESDFGELVRHVVQGGNATHFLVQKRPPKWWTLYETKPLSDMIPSNMACKEYNGILHIAHAGEKEGIASSFFTSVLNQLIYAENYNLKPWIFLNETSRHIYDKDIHGSGKFLYRHTPNSMTISESMREEHTSLAFPGPPLPSTGRGHSTVRLTGNGIWQSYFEQVSDFVPGDDSCTEKPFLSISAGMVAPGLNSLAPWSVKAWQYDDLPDDLWRPNNTTLQSWLEPMRRKASNVVKRWFRFHPFIINRAQEVNPVNETSLPCLAVHLRNTGKYGIHREKFPPKKFQEYFNAFARAGGKDIYIASDSIWTLEYIDEQFSPVFKRMIRTQGNHVVRSSWKWPTHMLEKHHRTNSETLVDILAMSKCQLLLHGNSAVSEAAIYLNLDLHNHSVNWEDPDRMSAEKFENVSRQVLGTVGQLPVDIDAFEKELVRSISIENGLEKPRIIKGDDKRQCRKNAIVYLAQKQHSSYGRDSFGILLESLKLLNQNYLSLQNHRDNTDLMIFHTADFKKEDMDLMESLLGSEFRSVLYFVDISNTTYWQRPPWHRKENPLSWYAFPLFSEGYRKMMHWFAIDIWRFFKDHGEATGCNYDYIMRFDEDSFLHSAVEYDLFDFMAQNRFNYGFRLCAYELQVTQRIWTLWRASNSPLPVRDIDLDMCGVYNNFFIAKLSFFQSRAVQRFLKFVDRQGLIYRRRLGDLMIHSLTVYAFSPPEKIHRFLDFTYEHSTIEKKTGCVVWGGIQAGYNDLNATATLEEYMQKKVIQAGCTANITYPTEQDLSPTYQHLPSKWQGRLKLETIMAGKVELPGMGLLSG